MSRERWKSIGAHAVGLWETAGHGATYNPLSPGVIQNPYKTYARLRRRSPVHRSAILGSWVLTRHEDVLAAAKDHERFSNDPRWRGTTTSVLPPAPDDYSILLVDPPEHTRLRKVAARAFTRAKLNTLRETVTHTAAELIERAARRRTVDWIAEVAEPPAMRVMLAMMGIPEHDRGRWETWSRERARLLEMIATRRQRRTAHLAGAKIRRYFKALLADRMQSSETDAVSTLARQVDAGGAISSAEACDMLSVLMIAGNETTTNLIGNGMLALAAPSRAAAAIARGAGPGPRRGERDAALRQSGADRLPDRQGGDHHARAHDPARRWRHSAHRIGQSRRDGVRAC